jgi:hypothetical protein
MSKYFLPSVAPLREALQLASLVPNIQQPEQDGFPTPKLKAGEDYPALTEIEDYWVQPQGNLGKLLEASTDTAFTAHVTKILSSAYGRSASDTKWLGPCEVRKYTLVNPKLLFRDLIKRASVRQWLRDEIEYGTRKVYFIVGYFTALDAVTFGGVQQGSKVKVKGTVPVGDIVTHGATTLIPGLRDLDVSGSIKHEGGSTTVEGSYMRGERVYALCYREVKWSIFPLRDRAATAKLQKDNCWTLTTDNRGQDDGEDHEGVQVDLDEDDEGGEDSFEIMEEDGDELDEE